MTTPAGQIEVLDGDTLRLHDGSRVRLPGVDAPELGRPGARQAADFMASRLAGRHVTLVPADPPRDAYGRLLADLQADGESLSLGLVERGLAWVYDRRATALIAAQATAVEAGLGVHARLALAGPAPFVVTSERFHRRDCPWVAGELRRRDLEADAGRLLRDGYAPCRTCLPWPP